MEELFTKSVNKSSTISETTGGTLRKVDAIRPVISPSKCKHTIVISIIHQGVTEDEEAWYLRLLTPGPRQSLRPSSTIKEDDDQANQQR